MNKFFLNKLNNFSGDNHPNKVKLLAPGFIFLMMLIIYLIITMQPALAHHAIGGTTPDNFFEGFISGLAHPVIGLDHFAFVVAISLVAVLKEKFGFFIPVVFVLATIAGTVIHLLSINLPIPEIIVAGSVLTVGLLLIKENKPNTGILLVLSTIAGIFHGYAYGESIIGAEMTPLGAYLFGFSLIQLIVAAIAFYLGRLTLNKMTNQPNLYLQFAGYLVCGIGLSFLSTTVFS
ncbi:HupE/UreJ protein [Stanieria cyanosphaera PCC 7437]|uniref:HupE/UreJ protein n=1 Tax=Stanieria cyanosphaera (strain ATCC 29371 / PCC 7437) TaxID=111780 RepID=K9XQ90_STAC7|nr:HupE/UreJ family protein [Stanieria cyanosphaera]AFZ34683.1 HupE/UreJ protein [Stanieria cyanosphaera PCC 7437]